MDFQFVTPSIVNQYLFCKKFTYFLNVLRIDQREGSRSFVMKGREIHARKMVVNKEYIRKSIGVIDKQIDVYLSSEKLRLVGRVDEVIFFANGSAASLDYKYAFWENKVYKSLHNQQVLYAMLIEENLQVKVNSAYIVYVRSKNHLEKLQISETMKARAKHYLDEIFAILNLSLYPESEFSSKCLDCAYRNICIP